MPNENNENRRYVPSDVGINIQSGMGWGMLSPTQTWVGEFQRLAVYIKGNNIGDTHFRVESGYNNNTGDNFFLRPTRELEIGRCYFLTPNQTHQQINTPSTCSEFNLENYYIYFGNDRFLSWKREHNAWVVKVTRISENEGEYLLVDTHLNYKK